MARDHRQIMSHEEHLRRALKLKALALSTLCRMIARQESHITWIREGDATTHFFHAHANGQCKRKLIRSLHHDGQMLVDEDRKAEALFQFFNDILVKPAHWEHMLNLDLLDLPQINLSELSGCFTEEVLTVICSLTADKALGPYGFTVGFLHTSWDTIRAELMLAFDAFWHLHIRKFHAINKAIMVLLSKSHNAKTIKEYRPISLIHVLGKLFLKVLVNWLVPRLEELIHVT
jgi:hypothetical protein